MVKHLKILGIESSCDDTCIAIITSNRKILTNQIKSQDNDHQPFQGIVPEVAARSHLINLEKVFISALIKSNINLSNIDAIAATCGPGLIGGIIIGATFGKTIASILQKPFIAINHLEGHILIPKINNNINYPYLTLIISGGHSQFVMVQKLGQYKILGKTIDDSLGETFDKIGKMLGLKFPGGPKIEQLAKLGNPHKYCFPQPIINQNNCNMSFSGLKTYIKNIIINLKYINKTIINDISASFQYTIGNILSKKIQNSIKIYESFIQNYSNISKTFVLTGGVASNRYLRTIIKETVEKLQYTFIAPPIKLCTDNAVMIALAGLERLENNLIYSDINFNVNPKWDIENLYII